MMKRSSLSVLLTVLTTVVFVSAGVILTLATTRSTTEYNRRGIDFSIPSGWVLSGEFGEILGTARNPGNSADHMTVMLLIGTTEDLPGLSDNRAAIRQRQTPTFRVFPETVRTSDSSFSVEYSYISDGADGSPRVISGRETYRVTDNRQIAVIAVESEKDRFSSFSERYLDRLSGIR